jgi:hypothetical protein
MRYAMANGPHHATLLRRSSKILAYTASLNPKTHPQTSSSRPPGSAQHTTWNIPLSARPGQSPDRWPLVRPIRRFGHGLGIATTQVSSALEGEEHLMLLSETRALCSSSRTTSDYSARTSGRGDSLRSGRGGMGKYRSWTRVVGLRGRWRSGLVEEPVRVMWFRHFGRTPLGLQGRSRRSHSLEVRERRLRVLVEGNLCRELG